MEAIMWSGTTNNLEAPLMDVGVFSVWLNIENYRKFRKMFSRRHNIKRDLVYVSCNLRYSQRWWMSLLFYVAWINQQDASLYLVAQTVA